MASTEALVPHGLAESDLLELHRRMVLLRTYDERSVVYHRQGRIGTYAIFWNHEAIQAGATFALARRRLDLPLVPRVRDRARARDAGRDDPAMVARPSVGLVEPGRLERRVDRGADRDARAARGRARVGQEAARRAAVAMAFFGDGATSEGAFHEGVNLAAVMNAPAVFVCNNNQWAISTPIEAQTRAETLADKAVGYGIPGVRVDGLDVLAVYEAAREAVERARSGGGPTLIEARALPRRAARDRRRPARLHRPRRASRRSARTSASAATSGSCKRPACSRTNGSEAVRKEAEDLMRAGIAAAEAEPPADPELLFPHAYVDPPGNMRNG